MAHPGGAGQLGPGLPFVPVGETNRGKWASFFFLFAGFRVGLWCFFLFSVLFSFHVRSALHILCFIFISKKLYITHNLLWTYIYRSISYTIWLHRRWLANLNLIFHDLRKGLDGALLEDSWLPSEEIQLVPLELVGSDLLDRASAADQTSVVIRSRSI